MRRWIIAVALISALIVVGCTTGGQPKPNPEAKQAASTGVNRGDSAPEFSVKTTTGEEVSLSSFSSQKRPVLVYFFATWCPFCAKDFSTLSGIYNEYANDVAIIAMSLDLSEGQKEISEYQKKYPALSGIKWAPSTAEILANYRVRSTTTKYAVSSEGKIIYGGSGAFSEQQWRTLLEALKNA